MREKRTDEQDILQEVGIFRASYRGTWIYEVSGDAQEGQVVLAVYYDVSEDDISNDIKHWRDVPHSRAAINQLLSSMKLSEDLPLPYVKHGRYHFFNAMKPAASYSLKDVAAVASTSTMRWTLAFWDEDKQSISVVKYRS